MMKRIFLYFSLLTAGLILLCGCAGAPSTTPVAENPTAPAATAAPSPAPTEAPVFPCDITFESDRDGNLEVYKMAPDGSGQVNLTNDPAQDFDPVWSPDGAFIAFVSDRANDTEGGQYIYTMLADGGEVTRVSDQNDSQFPDWSPTGGHIAYNALGDIFVVNISDLTGVNLTNSPELDEQPKISPDGQRIAWLKTEDNTRQLFVMDLDGGNITRVTNGGHVSDAEWTIDGRLFTHWEQPEGICFNCVVKADGSAVIDAGGKGTIQEFLPFWTADGARVELIAGDVRGAGNDDISLVGEIFPDIFMPLTDSPGNDRNPDAAFRCGPERGSVPQDTPAAGEAVKPDSAQSDHTLVIGYTGSLNPASQFGIDKACSELEVTCVKGESITSLADQGVDAIVNASNRWDVMGTFPQQQDMVSRGIPLFMLNAESSLEGVYNLSAEQEIITTTLTWMFKEMGDQGKFVYYNFGNSDYIQQTLEAVLKGYPAISPISKQADYNGNSFTQQDILDLITSDPEVEAVWSTEQMNDIFWAINDRSNSRTVLTECMARKDELISWKNEIDTGAPIRCIAQIRPGGTAYEGVYVAYYYLNGLKFKPDAFTREGGNTLRYDIPVITNETLPEWIGSKLDSYQTGENGFLELPAMTPEEIKSRWFEE
ncbi:MAG TPA: hypothetical protein PKK59_11515 [Anaerolineaceae bacterium]|nr:hypothetical protein [Anaerolineaceae bacterium]